MVYSTGPPKWPNKLGEFVCITLLCTFMFAPEFTPSITYDSFNLSEKLNEAGANHVDSPWGKKPIDYPLLL